MAAVTGGQTQVRSTAAEVPYVATYRRLPVPVRRDSAVERRVAREPATPIQRKAMISAPDSPDEREADAVADAVLSGRPASIHAFPTSVQRRCAVCEEETRAIQRKCAKCEEDDQTRIQAKGASGPNSGSLGGDVAIAATRQGGTALSASLRSYFEPRFGHDFSGVRVHTGSAAADGARAINARAYTIGPDIVFGTGEYAPSTPEGRRLLAHELVHTVQQSVGGLRLHRACLPAATCAVPQATLTDFVATTQSNPVNVSKAAKRKTACGKVPPDPSCVSDGHGAKASALTALVQANYPSRLGYISGIFVDKDIPSAYGAVTYGCSAFTPPLPGGTCTFVPDTFEAQAKVYNGGAAKIGTMNRQQWLTHALSFLTHETEHARFDAGAPIAAPGPAACKYADHQSNLSEMAAHLSMMHVYYRAALAKPDKDRFKAFYGMFNYWVKNGSEDINGIVTSLRCKCECADADYFITKTAESVSNNQKWDSNELSMIHRELGDPKWNLKWPVAPPASIQVGDLPTVAAGPFKVE